MKIQVGRNKTPALIDKEDYERVLAADWYLCNTEQGYITLKRKVGCKRVNGCIRYIYTQRYLHRWIMEAPKNKQIDHINGDKMDNRKENLRLCSGGENARNQPPTKGKYKGVHFAKLHRKWCAQITKNYKCIHIGLFKCQHCAAKAYNNKATQLHREFAYLNEVEKCSCPQSAPKKLPIRVYN